LFTRAGIVFPADDPAKNNSKKYSGFRQKLGTPCKASGYDRLRLAKPQNHVSL